MSTDDTWGIILDAYRDGAVDGMDALRLPDGVDCALTYGDEAFVLGWDVWEGEGGYTWTIYADLAEGDIITTDGGDDAAAREAVAAWVAALLP